MPRAISRSSSSTPVSPAAPPPRRLRRLTSRPPVFSVRTGSRPAKHLPAEAMPVRGQAVNSRSSSATRAGSSTCTGIERICSTSHRAGSSSVWWEQIVRTPPRACRTPLRCPQVGEQRQNDQHQPSHARIVVVEHRLQPHPPPSECPTSVTSRRSSVPARATTFWASSSTVYAESGLSEAPRRGEADRGSFRVAGRPSTCRLPALTAAGPDDTHPVPRDSRCADTADTQG
jgi:hypothetical protein